MELIGHLQLLYLLCGIIMGPLIILDKIVKRSARRNFISKIKSHNFSYIENRNFLIDLLKLGLRCREMNMHIFQRRYVVLLPNWKHFVLVHFFLITLVAWIISVNEPLFHDAHDGAKKTGWVIGKYQVHIMIFIELASIYLCTMLISFPLDFLSASKTLTIANRVSGKSKGMRMVYIFLDILITSFLVSVSLLMLGFILHFFGLDLPKSVFVFLGGQPDWQPNLCVNWRCDKLRDIGYLTLFVSFITVFGHSENILMQFVFESHDQFFNAAFVTIVSTAFIIWMIIVMHIALMTWFILDLFRIFRDFVISNFYFNTYPFTTTGLFLCAILVCLYFIILIVIGVWP